MKRMLPGVPRDLNTIEAHVARAYTNSVTLWAHNEMRLRNIRTGKYSDQTQMLREIRHDMDAMRSCIEALKKELDDGC